MTGIRGVLPIATWLPIYDRADLRVDAVAGVTVSALVIPKALGYAGIAQVPLENGLYAAAAGALIYALFATSRQISTGPSSALAAVAASAVVTTGVAGDEAAELVAAITIAAGVLFVALAVFKMGWISQFLSKAVITGFLFGAAIDVTIGELPKLSGTDASGDSSWRQLAAWIGTIGDFHRPTLVVGLVSLVGILVLRFTVPRVPGALALVVFGLVASWMFDLADRGIAVVGDVPRGLPRPVIPDAGLVWDNINTVAAAAAALLLIGFSQTAGDARTFAARHRYRIDVNQESVAQGMSNLGAGLFQGMPVSTSLSASSLNDSAGARTAMASIVTGGVVVLTLLFLAPLFSDLPKAVLGALIIDAVVFGMMDVAEMRRLWRVKRFDCWIAIAAILAVLSFGVLAGVIVGMALSLGWLVYVSTHPAMPELGRRPGSSAFRPLHEFPDSESVPGLLVIRFDAGLFFVTADVLEQRLRDAVVAADEPIVGVVIDFAGVNFIDSQGSAELSKISTMADNAAVGLRLARVKPQVMSVLDADGVRDVIGRDRFHNNVDEAVNAELEAPPRPSGRGVLMSFETYATNAQVTQLFEQIDAIAPTLQAGTREAETLGRLPDASIDALHSSGLFRLWRPAELGGVGASLTDAIETIERLAAVDTSAAWVLAVGSAHGGFAGAYLASHAAEEIFAGEEPVIAGQMAPVGRARRVEGGLRVTGAWSFGSGIHHANWVLAGAMVIDDAGRPAGAVVIVAPIEAAVIDESSWQVAGLAGTGSCDYRLDDLFVPEGWWFSFPVAERLRGAAVFDLPAPAQAVILHGGFALGTARRSLDEISRLAVVRTRANDAVPLGRHPAFQLELAEGHARVAAARLYVYDAARRLQSAPRPDVARHALESRAAGRYATDVAVDITTWAYRHGGGTALRLDHPLQQMLRDTLGATQHLFVDDAAYTALGAALVEEAAGAASPDDLPV